ncbi:hypothetical protein [Photobacterium sp. J15]|uniref:hypothetical protein n=1 Tax=Photobacterium sp. J15 TaxID=265901 RepID=UPI0007E40126|nr:hypothetical protein [Photobacterium sp. J15]
MKKNHYLFLLITLISGYSLAGPHSYSHTHNALPDNEKLCMQTVSRLLTKQHVIFSDTKSTPEIRRAAERAIDITRKAFKENQSYCDAQHALQAYKQDPDEGFRHKPGEINKFIHSNS